MGQRKHGRTGCCGARRALIRFPLLTFGVITRIHWQALRLWIKKVTFFSKPVAPLKETTS